LGYNTYIHGNGTKKPTYGYVKQTKMSLFFCKAGEQEGRTDPVWEVVTSGRGRICGEGRGGYKHCVHRYVHGKMRPVETIPGMGLRGIKENDGGGEFSYDIL
jgi:hypothetical protein